MAKFCTKCGKKLEEGQVCECEVKKTSNVAPTNNDFVELLKEYVEVVKSFLKKPIDTLKDNTNESKFNLSLVSIGAFALSIGIFMLVLCKIIENAAINNFGFLLGYGFPNVGVPYIKVFLISIVAAILFMTLLSAIAYFISEKLLKGKTSFKKMVTLFSFSSIISTISILVAAVCLFIDVRLALLVLVAGFSLNAYYNYKGLEFVTKTDINMLGYILMPAVMISTFIIGFIIPKILF